MLLHSNHVNTLAPARMQSFTAYRFVTMKFVVLVHDDKIAEKVTRCQGKACMV